MNKEHIIEMINNGIIATNTKDVYSCGMRNGMRWCKSLLDDKAPEFEDASHCTQPERSELIHVIFETLSECGIYGEEATAKLIGVLKRLGRSDLLPPCAR